jgi:hypothetical protein
MGFHLKMCSYHLIPSHHTRFYLYIFSDFFNFSLSLFCFFPLYAAQRESNEANNTEVLGRQCLLSFHQIVTILINMGCTENTVPKNSGMQCYIVLESWNSRARRDGTASQWLGIQFLTEMNTHIKKTVVGTQTARWSHEPNLFVSK